MMVYEDTAERHRFDSFCKVVLRHAMLDCFREFSSWIRRFLSRWVEPIIRKEITFCPTCPHLKAFLLGYGDSDGDNI